MCVKLSTKGTEENQRIINMLIEPKVVKTGRPRKIRVNPGQMELDLDGIMQAMAKSDSARDTVAAMLAAHRATDVQQWRGMIAVPPGGLADAVISEFRTKTNIPLEIPFFTLLSIISGLMLAKGCVLKTPLGEILPDIWTIVLASSGAGKTYSKKNISGSLDLSDIEFGGTGIVSAAAFVMALSAKPRSLWIRDEFAQFLKKIDADVGPMSEMKDYMLQLYDNSTIERATKKELITVKKPAVSILGLTVTETFGNYVSAESMLDGFAQRFSYVKADTDPARYWRDYATWQVKSERFDSGWKKIIDALNPVYTVDPDICLSAFSTAFQSLFDDAVPESFYRRSIWKANKYAMIYHALRGDPSHELTAEDYGWAARVVYLHVKDAAWLVGAHNLGPLEKILMSAEKVVKRIYEKEKRLASTREMIQGVAAIKNVAMAQQILSLIGDSVFKPAGKLKP